MALFVAPAVSTLGGLNICSKLPPRWRAAVPALRRPGRFLDLESVNQMRCSGQSLQSRSPESWQREFRSFRIYGENQYD